MSIEVLPLGAGQDVGRSCIIVKIDDRTIMFDCGLHMGFSDHRRFPDFSYIKEPNQKLDDVIDVMLLSHFHLDHCGALPYMTERVGYKGPLVMTAPTRAIVPHMLDDFRRVSLESKENKEKDLEKDGAVKMDVIEPELYTYNEQDIKECMQKVRVVQLHETIVIKDMKIKPYYAGHVLGACMFLVEYKGKKVVYTGDYNANSDRHLGAAWMDKVKPDVLITETTYATTLRDSKRTRERDFLKLVQETIDNGGKVLIPVFALGRAQELCILLETYWARTKSKVPIYFAAGLIEKANFYYKLFINWTNEKIKSNFIKNNMFDFKYISPFDKLLVKSAGPMVLLATPGMLHGGLSMQVFKEWCQDEKNTLVIPGFCVAGTLGNKLLSGVREINIDGKNYDIRMKITNMSFSAHADAKGILNLIKHTEAQNVVFVHGEKKKMEVLREVIKDYFEMDVFMPANFERIKIPIANNTKNGQISRQVIEMNEGESLLQSQPVREKKFTAMGIYNENEDDFRIMTYEETIKESNKMLKIMKNDDIDRIILHDFNTGCFLKLPETYRNKFMSEEAKTPGELQGLIRKDLLRMSEKIFKDQLMTDQSLATYPMNYKFEIEFEQDRVLIAFKSDQQKKKEKHDIEWKIIEHLKSYVTKID